MSQFTATVTPANQFTVSVSPAQSLVTITHQQVTVTVSAVGVQGPQGASGGGGGGGSGDVVGPASSVADRVAVFSGTTGKLLADGGATIAEVRARASHTGVQAIATVTGLQTALDGKEAAGTDAASMAAHVAAADPHPTYTTAIELNAAIAAHEAAGDPHPTYTTASEAAAAAPVQSVAGRTGAVVLAKSDVGLGSVDNTTDAAKPVSADQQTALNLKANLASPTLTGTPAAPTAAADTNTTQIATTAFVQQEITNDVTKATVAHTHAEADVTGLTAALALKAPLASPALTGTPTVPTAAIGTNTTQAASTAFVVTEIKGDTITDSPGTDQNDYNPTGFSTARVVRVSPTTSIKLTGMAGGAAGVRKTIINVGVGMMLIPNEDTDSSAANRFSFTAAIPILLLPGESIDAAYDATTSRWRPIGNRSGFAQLHEWQDYTTVSGALSTAAVSGTDASVQAGAYGANSTERSLGVAQCDTGSTNAGRAGIGGLANSMIVPGQGQALYLCRISPETSLSTSGERYDVIVGFNDSLGTTDVTDGVYWRYKESSSAVWKRCSAQATNRTETDSSVTVTTTYIWLGIYMNADWTRADFFYSEDSINWEFAGSNTANLPSSSQFTNICANIVKSVGATQRNLAIDGQGWRYDVAR